MDRRRYPYPFVVLDSAVRKSWLSPDSLQAARPGLPLLLYRMDATEAEKVQGNFRKLSASRPADKMPQAADLFPGISGAIRRRERSRTRPSIQVPQNDRGLPNRHAAKTPHSIAICFTALTLPEKPSCSPDSGRLPNIPGLNFLTANSVPIGMEFRQLFGASCRNHYAANGLGLFRVNRNCDSAGGFLLSSRCAASTLSRLMCHNSLFGIKIRQNRL